MKFRYVVLAVIALVVLGAIEGFFIHKHFFSEASSEETTCVGRANMMGSIEASNLKDYGDRVVYWEDEYYCGDYGLEVILAYLPWDESLQKGFAVYKDVHGENELDVFELAPTDSGSLSYEVWLWKGEVEVVINGESFYTYRESNFVPRVDWMQSSVELYEY